MLPSLKYIIVFLPFYSFVFPFRQSSTQNEDEIFADCVLNISKTYFDPNLATAIQTPETWFKQGFVSDGNTDNLLQLLSTYSTIPQVIAGYETSLKVQALNVIKPGSYILVIPKVQTKRDELWTIDMFKRFMSNLHNPRARSIIVINWPVTNTRFLSRFLLFLAGFYSFIHTIVIQKQCRSEKCKISNLGVYGWLLEDQDDICPFKMMKKIRRLDTWIGSKKAFLLNNNLFPSKIMKHKSQCNPTVCFANVPPLAYPELGRMKGGYVELIKYISTNPKFETAEQKNDIRNYDIMGPMSYTAANIFLRECVMTYPYFAQEYIWYVPSGEKVPAWKSLFKAFSPLMWVSVITTSVFWNLFLWFLLKTRGKLLRKHTKDGNDVIMNALLTHLGVGVKQTFNGPACGLLFTLWLFYCLLINTAYQSTLFGLMVDTGQYPSIQTISELEESKLVLKTTVIIYNMREKRITTLGGYEYCDWECFEELGNENTFAVLTTTFTGELIRPLIHDSIGRLEIVALKETVDTDYVSLNVGRFSCILYDRVETLIHRAVSSGLFDKWNSEFIVGWNRKPEIESLVEVIPVFALRLWNVQGAFYICIIGLLLSTLVFIVEILRYPNH